MKRKTLFSVLALISVIVLLCLLIQFWQTLDQPFKSVETAQSELQQEHFGIPHIVHQTWKHTVSPPSELVRWRNGCIAGNKEFNFVMYSDDDLQAFTKLHYPRYLAMFEHLSGVYMADMARVLVSYHFGGIYMDLDFYCHRPFRCLIQRAQKQWQMESSSSVNTSSAATLPRNLLVVAREPLAHAVLFRHKTRVVIQDFFLTTPRHPFLRWLLEDRLQLFLRSQGGVPADSNSANASGVVMFPKGPFSYSIEKDIDRYRSSFVATAADEAIIELAEDVLHPLIDATNSRLVSECANHRSEVGKQSDAVSAARIQVCSAIQQHAYFAPSPNTVLVHMWTHVYLGWSFVRGLYNAWTYRTVQNALPPTDKSYMRGAVSEGYWSRSP